MANNLMYLVNSKTGDKFLLAKYYHSTGWYCSGGTRERLNDFFEYVDFGDKVSRPEVAAGGLWGADWKLVLDVDG